VTGWGEDKPNCPIIFIVFQFANIILPQRGWRRLSDFHFEGKEVDLFGEGALAVLGDFLLFYLGNILPI
jgi:hypothetical protein